MTRNGIKYFIKMFSFLGNLPDVAVRKIYSACDTKTKWMLNKTYNDTETINPLKRSGCLDHKELLFCFLCQNDIYYNNFCTGPWKNWHGASRILTDDVLKEFEVNLNNVYQTRNLDALYQHLVTEHGPHDFLPKLYWDKMDNQINTEYEFGTNADEMEMHVRQTMIDWGVYYDPFTRYKMALERKKVHKSLAKILVRGVFQQLSLCHAIGNRWEPLLLSYEGSEPTLVPEYKAIRSFNLFLYNIKQQHMVQNQMVNQPGGYYSQFESIGKKLY